MNVDAVRTSLLATVAAESGQARAEARGESALRLAEARAQAHEIVSEARRLGELDAEAAVARRRVRAQRRARTLALEARRQVFDAFRREAVSAALELRASREYGALLERLEEAARDQLGEGATIERDPPGSGGVVGRAGGRSVDYSLPALVDRCVAGLGDELQELWP